MYIHEFAVRNYLIHQNTKVSLSPITVFVGPNGGGKSAFFDAILNFSMVARGNIRQAFGPYPYSFNATRFHGARPIERIAFDVTISCAKEDAERLRYKIDYTQQGAADSGWPTFQIFSETLRTVPGGLDLFDRSDTPSSPLGEAIDFLENDRSVFAAIRAAHMSGVETQHASVADFARDISKFNKFRLNPFTLAGFSRLPDVSDPLVRPRLGHEGEDLAACLYFMEQAHDPLLDVISDKVRAVLPGFLKFEFTTFGADRVAFSMQFEDERGTVPAVRVSHGILTFVGLTVLVCSPNRPAVMLIEEPENGLTPTALKEFYRSIRDLANRENAAERSQILISSHSPFIICEAWNGEDREFIHQVKVENGHAIVRKFSEVIREQGIQLRRDDTGQRTVLGLRNAEELMAGYLS